MLFLIKKSLASKILKHCEVFIMKGNKLNSILAGVATLLIGALFLLLIAPGVNFDGSACYGYDLMFGNDSIAPLVSPVGAFIAVFVLLIVAAVFNAAATTFYSIDKQNQSHKFCAFLMILAGLAMGASAALFFLAPMFFADFAGTVSLSWGGIACGAASAVAAVASLVGGVKGILVK